MIIKNWSQVYIQQETMYNEYNEQTYSLSLWNMWMLQSLSEEFEEIINHI